MRFTSRAARAAAAFVAASLAFAACGGDDDDTGDDAGSSAPAATDVVGSDGPATTGSSAAPGSTAATDGEPRQGGSITSLEINDIPSFDFFKINLGRQIQSAGSVFYSVFGSLITINADGSVEPGQAESVESPDGGATWRITLRPGMTFTDGEPFDAEALKWNYEHAVAPESVGVSSSSAKLIASMNVVDATTLDLTLATPLATFDRYIARNLNYIASPKAVQELGDQFGEKPIGAGPFILQEWVRGDHVTLVRNPDYWDAPRPYLDELTFRLVPDEQQRMNSLTAGEADLALVQSAASLPRAEQAGLHAYSVDLGGGWYIGFNNLTPPFDDVRMRKAISLAFDFDRFNEAINGGVGRAATTLFPEGHQLHNDVTLSTYDPVEAQRLIDEYAAEHGGPVRFLGISTDSTFERGALEFVQTSLAGFDNIEMDVQPLPQGEHAERVIQRHDFQLNVWAAQGLDMEPTIYGNLHTGPPLNISGYSTPEMDTALETGRSTDLAARQAAYTDVSEILARDMPIFFFAGYTNSAMATDRLENVLEAISEYSIRTDWISLGDAD